MNEGLKALRKASPEAFENITGQKAMYGMKNPMAEYGKKIMMAMGGMNSLSEKEKQQYAAMGMKAIKEYGMGGKMYEDGGKMENVYDDLGNIVGTKKNTSGLRSFLGADEVHYDNDGNKVAKVNEKRNKTKVTLYEDGGKMYDEGGLNEDGGPFASAKSKIESNLSPLKGNLMSQIESDPKKAAWAKENIPGGLENATVYQLSQAADPNHSETQTNRLTRLARQADLPVATETANLYSRMNSGKFDVDVMDGAMIARGYDGEAGDIFATGVVEGKIPLGAMISADTKDLGTTDSAGKFNFKVFDVPSGAEFLQTNRRRIKGDGSIRGDNQDDLTWYAQLGRGDRRDVSPESEAPETIIPDPPMQSGPGDPMASIPGRGPSQIPVNRPQPSLQGGMRPLKDPTPTGDPGLGRFDIGALEPMISDFTGSEEMRASGPGAGQTELERRMLAQQLAAMLQRKMGGRMYLFGGKNKGRGRKKYSSIDVEVKGGQTVGGMGSGGRMYKFGGKY
jgi:hypothetical protein